MHRGEHPSVPALRRALCPSLRLRVALPLLLLPLCLPSYSLALLPIASLVLLPSLSMCSLASLSAALVSLLLLLAATCMSLSLYCLFSALLLPFPLPCVLMFCVCTCVPLPPTVLSLLLLLFALCLLLLCLCGSPLSFSPVPSPVVSFAYLLCASRRSVCCRSSMCHGLLRALHSLLLMLCFQYLLSSLCFVPACSVIPRMCPAPFVFCSVSFLLLLPAAVFLLGCLYASSLVFCCLCLSSVSLFLLRLCCCLSVPLCFLRSFFVCLLSRCYSLPLSCLLLVCALSLCAVLAHSSAFVSVCLVCALSPANNLFSSAFGFIYLKRDTSFVCHCL
eukprot:SAG11_NODE_64_length_18817_cov_64.238327_5_plen_333_part_00